MLELMGAEYVIDHVVAEHSIRMHEKAYRSYTCDVLKIIAEQAGATVNMRFVEMIDTTPKDERTADEIALEVIQKAGLIVKE